MIITKYQGTVTFKIMNSKIKLMIPHLINSHLTHTILYKVTLEFFVGMSLFIINELHSKWLKPSAINNFINLEWLKLNFCA